MGWIRFLDGVRIGIRFEVKVGVEFSNRVWVEVGFQGQGQFLIWVFCSWLISGFETGLILGQV